jgi:hypothetical protein
MTCGFTISLIISGTASLLKRKTDTTLQAKCVPPPPHLPPFPSTTIAVELDYTPPLPPLCSCCALLLFVIVALIRFDSERVWPPPPVFKRLRV